MRRVLLALFLVVAGCGGDDDTTSGSQESVDEAEDQSDTGSENEATAAETPTADEVKAALLTVEDLPEGYTESPEEEEDDSGDQYCDGLDPTESVPAAVEAEIAFAKDALGPFVGESILQYSSDDEAERFMDETGALLDECASYEQTDEDGNTSKVTLTDLSFDRLGDETVAIRIEISGGFPVDGHLVAVRHDDLVILLSQIVVGDTIDENLSKSLVAKALDKAEALR